jgi:hypothetical protein
MIGNSLEMIKQTNLGLIEGKRGHPYARTRA